MGYGDAETSVPLLCSCQLAEVYNERQAPAVIPLHARVGFSTFSLESLEEPLPHAAVTCSAVR